MKSFEICNIYPKSLRVDTFISTLFSDLTRSYIAKCIEKWDIKVNSLQVKKHFLVRYWDLISFQEIISSYHIWAENIPLDIVYEDDNLIVLNKQANINVHPVPGIEGKRGTLVNAILYHTQWNLPIISWEERPGIVHRLDKDTSWALLIAKNDSMMQYLTGVIKAREIKKYYLAVTTWVPQEKYFTIRSQIGRDRYERTKMTIRNPLNPKNAVTHIELLWNYDWKYGLLKIDLETGRTHQIRVHLASMWFPILWDKIYGNTDINLLALKQLWVKRHMLHAHTLEFQLYDVLQSFIAPLKDDMKVFFQDEKTFFFWENS